MLNENENDLLQYGGNPEPASAPEAQPDNTFEDIASGAVTHDDFSAAEEPVVQAQEEAAAGIPTQEAQPEKPAAGPQTEAFEQPPKQPDPVYAEPVGGYASSQTIPPYGSAPQYGGAHYYNNAQQSNIPPYGAQRAASNPYVTQQPYGQPAYGGYNAAPPAQPAQPKSRKGLKALLTIIAVLVVAGIGIGIGAMIGTSRNRGSDVAVAPDDGTPGITAAADAPEMETKASPASGGFKASGAALTPTEIAAKVKESSVGILVYSRASTGVASEGSGVVWKEDSSGTYTYIITCAHVVSGSSGLTYTVQTCDGDTYDAELVGADSKTDLAVLRVKSTELAPAEFGDSSKLQVGDPVYAIGNPGGTEFFGSFTSGIVSAIDRSVKSTNTTVCIQHTAAINPGNSGGALVNQYGQVIGINSQKIVNTQYEGMGFAIPIKSAQKIINNLATYGYVKDRPKLGITYAEAVNYQQYGMIIKIKGLPSGALLIMDINNDSTLKDTQAEQYDMIIRVNGEDMTKPEVLLDKIENGKVGDKLTLTLCRVDNNYQTKEFDVTVTLIEESKGGQPETTTQQTINPYDFFNGDFFDGLF